MTRAREVESSPGHRVLVHWCRCGGWAAFGRGVTLRRALACPDGPADGPRSTSNATKRSEPWL